MMLCAEYVCLYDDYEVDELVSNIHAFVNAYQVTGATLFAWLVHRAASQIWLHPEYEGTDEERCTYRKLSKQWKMVALSSSNQLGA